MYKFLYDLDISILANAIYASLAAFFIGFIAAKRTQKQLLRGAITNLELNSDSYGKPGLEFILEDLIKLYSASSLHPTTHSELQHYIDIARQCNGGKTTPEQCQAHLKAQVLHSAFKALLKNIWF